MKHYIGIDGGGTKTKVCLMNEQEEILSMQESGPSSIDTVTSKETLFHITEALNKMSYHMESLPKITAVFAGIGGIITQEDKLHVTSLLMEVNAFKDSKIFVQNDMENALASGKCYVEGIALIVGTGMVAFGKDAFYNQHKSGGWGFKEGDAGSSFDLGFQAIKSTVRAFDGRFDKTAFHKEVFKQLNLNHIQEIGKKMDQLYLERTKVASFAPIVTKFANSNDFYAKRIVDQATDELALAVKAVYSHIKLSQKKVVIIGSLGNALGYFKSELHRKIQLIDPEIQILSPLNDPAYAAAILAKQYLRQHM